jgi:hypothetical protein
VLQVVLFMGCTLLGGLLLAAGVLPLFVAQYRELRQYWPHAHWLVGLQTAALAGALLLMLAFTVVYLLTSANTSLPLSMTDSRWAILFAVIYGLIGFTLLAFVGAIALVIAQRRRYGVPPRTPPLGPRNAPTAGRQARTPDGR